MLFLRREEKWDEVLYANMFFTLQNHPELQRDCGLIPPQDPMVLALERENNKEFRVKLRQCCSGCSIGQRCTNLTDLFKPPPQPQEQDENSDEIPTPSDSPVSSRTRISPSKTQSRMLTGLLTWRDCSHAKSGFLKEWKGPFPES